MLNDVMISVTCNVFEHIRVRHQRSLAGHDRIFFELRVCDCCHPISSRRYSTPFGNVGPSAGVTLEEGHVQDFFVSVIRLPSAVLALFFIARRVQQYLSLLDH